MRGLARAQSITTVSTQFSTNPFHNLKTYNPFEKQQGTKNNERKESEEIEHDQPILENLLKRANSSPVYSSPENMAANPRNGELSHCNSCGDHPENPGKLVRVIREFLHPENTESLIKLWFNLLMGIIVCVVVIMVFLTMKEDLHQKRAHEMEVVLLEIGQCTKDYYDNRCEPQNRRPAVEEYCLQVEKCMLQDPMKVIQSSKMTAALLAEIINEFIEPLGIKAIIIFFVFIFSLILFNRSFRSHHKDHKNE